MAADNTALIATALITKMTAEEMANELVFVKKVNHQFSKDFKEVGDSIKVRRPVYVEANDGAVIASFDEIEQGSILIPLSTQKNVALKVTSKDLTLEAEVQRENFAKPAARELAQKIESVVAAGIYPEIYNFTGTPGTLPSTFLNVSDAETLLTELGTPLSMERMGVYTARAGASLADGLKGVFPQSIALPAIERATLGNYANVSISRSNSLPTHTVGVNTGTPLVEGAAQETTYALSKDTWTQTFLVDGWTASQTGILKKGDVFTIDNVFAVNRRTRESTGQLQQFSVQADADSGAGAGSATFTISPPIIISGAQQTVDSSPANNAAVTVLTGTGGTSHIQNMVFVKDAIGFVMAPMAPNLEGTSSSSTFDGFSVRATMDYDITNDANLMRWDVLFGFKLLAPDMACRTTN